MAIAMQYGNGRNGLLNVGMSMTLLWTNVDDESAFAAQTLSLNIGGYDAVLIKFKLAANVSTYANTIGFVGERTTLYSSNASTTSYTYKRYATVTTSDITFSTGYRGATAGTSYAIPCEVYGIKRGGSSGGSSSSGSGGGGGGAGTLTQITFDGTVYTDDGSGNVTLSESDPVFVASDAYSITSTDITNWNNKSTFSGSYNDLTDTPSLSTVATSGDYADLSNTPTKLSDFTDDLGSSPIHTHSQYLTSYTETDPVFTASVAHSITSTDVTNWNAKQDAVSAGNGIDITTNVISNTQGIEYIVGTQAAATNAWTGVSKDSSLKTGKIIAYYLPYAGTSSAATLQLTMADGTTTAAIALRRQASSTVTTHFAAGNVIVLIYDGTYWKVSGYYYSDSNTVPTGYCTTAASTAAKSATCTYGYRDDATYFPCLFRYANTANNATLAIGTYATTALPIYVNGARTSSSNTFGAGVILFLYYNNAYYCYNDGRLPIVVNGSVTSVQDQFALYTPTASLATVATSGDYSDLSNTPVLATVATSGSYSDLSNTPSLATVATSGDYSDLSNTPVLATVATSGNYNDLSNKPTIPTVPTSVSAFINDAGYLTSYTETDPVFSASAAAGITSSDISDWNAKVDSLSDLGITATATELNYTDGVTSNIQDQLDAMASAVSFTATGAIASFVDGEGDKAFVDLVANIEPKQDLTYGDPYPAGGGANLLDPSTLTSYGTGYGLTSSISGDVITLSGTYTGSNTSASFRTLVVPTHENWSFKAFEITTTGTVNKLRWNNNSSTSIVVDMQNLTPNAQYSIKFKLVAYEAGTTAPGSYVPYENICPITGWTGVNVYHESAYDPTADPAIFLSWQTEAGTVYGGAIDVTTGLLTVDRQYIQLDGNSTIYYISSGASSASELFPYWAYFRIEASPANDYTKWRFSHGKVGNVSTPNIFRTYMYNSAGVGVVIGTESLCNTEALIQSFLQAQYNNGTPLQIVYGLATPVTYQLTPQDAFTLLGTNNVWADTGDVTVRYFDVASDYFVDKSAYKSGQLLQNKNLAYVESSARASRAYSVNNYFINANGVLCRITASVSSGGTLIQGTNYIIVTGGLANDLYSLLS